MGQHKTNPVAAQAANGEISYKHRPSKMERDAEFYRIYAEGMAKFLALKGGFPVAESDVEAIEKSVSASVS